MSSIKEQTFDLYSRNRIVKEITNQYFRRDNEKFTLLDLGGYKGDIEKFFPQDKVTILDVYDIKDKSNYIKGDATKLDFKDNSFDVTTSFDVLEHIPINLREDFIKESIRVAKKFAFIAFPMNTDNDKSVIAAETQLDAFFQHLTGGNHHPWLAEHIHNGIPSSHEVEVILNSLDVEFINIYSNDLDLWKSMQIINFASFINAEAQKLANDLNGLYRKNIESIEANLTNGYRAIYIIVKDIEYLKALKSIRSKNVLTSNNKKQWTASSFNTYVQDKTNLIMATKLRDYNCEILKTQEKDRKIQKLEEKVLYMSNSMSWRLTEPLRRIKKLFNSHRAS